MEGFNFDAPINATVIFDDSDDETKPFIDHLQIKEVESNNNTLNTMNELVSKEICNNLSYETNIIEKEKRSNLSKAETFEIIKASQNYLGTTTCGAPHDNSTATEKIQKQSSKSLDMPCLDDMDGTLQNLIESIFKNNDTNSQRKPDNQRNDKRKKTTDGKKTPQKRLTKEFNPNVDPKRLEVQEHNKVSTEINQHCNPATTYMETVSSNLLQPNNETREQLQLNTDTLLAQSLNETNKTVANYLRELLNDVSEHMISIINSYFTYLKVYRSNIDRSLIEHARNNFIYTKKHFFNLSYSTVVNVILSRENDTTFLKNFLHHTIKLAYSKSYAYTYHGQIRPLFIEMIGWVKKRREQIQSMNLTNTTRPLPLGQLQKPVPQHQPPPYPNQDKQIYKSRTEIDRNPIYSSRPPSTETDRNSIYLSRPPPAGNLNVDQQKEACPVVIPPQNSQQFNNEYQLYNTQPTQNTADIPNDNLQSMQNQTSNLLPRTNSSDIYNNWPDQKKSTPSWQFPTTQPCQKQAVHSWQEEVLTTQYISQNRQEMHVLLNNQNLPQVNSAQFEPNKTQPHQKQAAHSWQKDVPTLQHISPNHQELHILLKKQNLLQVNSAQFEPNRKQPYQKQAAHSWQKNVSTMQHISPNHQELHVSLNNQNLPLVNSGQFEPNRTQPYQKQAAHSWQKDVLTMQHISPNHQELHVSLNNQNLPQVNSALVEPNRTQPYQKQAAHSCQKDIPMQHISPNHQELHVSLNNQNLPQVNSALVEPNRTQPYQKQAAHSCQKDIPMQNISPNHQELHVSLNNQNLPLVNSGQFEPNRTQPYQMQAAHSWQKDVLTMQHISPSHQELHVSLNNQNLPQVFSAQFEPNRTQPYQKQAAHSWQKDVPTMQHISPNHQELHVSLNKQNLQQESSAQFEPNRSSISRDSGFISPLNFNSSSDQLCKFQEDQRSQMLMTPLITHVTSLNPNVSYISNGFCSVCGKTTKKKCLGCYKCYYCNQACQYLDWKKHMAICKSEE